MIVNDHQRLIEVWLTKADREDHIIQEKLRQLYACNKNKKNTIVVYHSGQQDIYRNTLDLLVANRAL